MFSKSSVFAVVALAAFVSLGALLFPQVGQAQECIWDCDLGSDFNDFPGENSPGFSIVYCFDQPCVAALGIFDGAIPTAFVKQEAKPNSCPSASTEIKISGNVVAVLRDRKGIIHPESAAEALFNVIVKDVICSGSSSSSELSRPVKVNELRTNVFDATSSITILNTPILNKGDSRLTNPRGWEGCPTNPNGSLSGPCPFPLGIVEFKNINNLASELPATGTSVIDYRQGEVYRGVGSVHFVGVRMCKGDANSTDPSTIACSVGGFEADAVFEFEGNWSGAQNHTINPDSGSNPYDIITPLFASIDTGTVTASANGGPTIAPTGCSRQPSQGLLRCSFIARDLLPNGCAAGTKVAIVVRGQVLLDADGVVDRPVKFVAPDDPTCSTK